METLDIIFKFSVPFLVMLTVLVFVHEMGHYLIARANNVRVEVFSIGFGKELFGWNDSLGTRWKICVIPLGGYVKMFGDADVSSSSYKAEGLINKEDREVSFHHKRLSQRTAIVLGGPVANFLFAIILFAVLYSVVGQRHVSPIIELVQSGSAAEKGGLLAGDRVIQIDSKKIKHFGDLRQIVSDSPNTLLEFVVRRDKKLVSLNVTPNSTQRKDIFGSEKVVGFLGVRGGQAEMIRHDPLSALWFAFIETWSITLQTLDYVGQMLVGERDTDDLGGPLRIAQLSGMVAEAGFVSFIGLMALLSINLGLINLFPIPVLDGGHLVFYFLEAVRGRPLGERSQEIASMVGLSVVIALMIFVTWNDLQQWKVFQLVGSIFG